MLTRSVPKSAKLRWSGAVLILIATTLLLPMAKAVAGRSQTSVEDANCPSVNGLRAWISCGTPKLKLEEPVVVTLSLENASDKDLVYYDFCERPRVDESQVLTLLVDGKPAVGYTTLDVSDGGYKVVAEHRRDNRVTGPGTVVWELPPLPREAFLTLKPDEKVAYAKVDVRPVWFLSESSKQASDPLQTPGEHSIQIEYKNAADGREFGLSAWVGEVKSNVLALSIVGGSPQQVVPLTPSSPASAGGVSGDRRQRLNEYGYREQFTDGQTHVSGTIQGNVRWTAQKSPYVLDENVFVSRDATLTIEPTVEVKVKRLTDNTSLIDAYVTLAVYGILRAEGKPDAMIRFVPVSDKPDPYREWRGIVIKRGSSTSILKWVLVRDAIFGIDAYDSALITHCVFLKCHSGIYLESDFVGDVRHNVSAYHAYSGIRCKGTRAEATITDNICYENGDGIDAWFDAVAYADYNIYWSSRRNPARYYIGMAAGPHDLTVDPRFVDPLNNNFTLSGKSPAKGTGSQRLGVGLSDDAWNEKVGQEEDRVWLSDGARRLWCEGVELERRSRPAALKKMHGTTGQETTYRNPAEEKFRQALERVSTPELKDMIMCSLARVLISEANYAPARQMLEAVVSASTQARIRDLARRSLADAWALDGRADEGLRIVRATEWAQSQVWARPAVARYSAMSGDYELTFRSLADIRKESPDRYVKTVSDMVSGALSANQLDAAVKIMAGFDEYPLAPQRSAAYLNIAKSARSCGRPEVAVDLLYKSTKADPFCREATESLSLLAALLKDDLNRPDEAQTVLMGLCREYCPYDSYVQQAAKTVRPEPIDPKRTILLDSSLGEWSIYDRGPDGSNNFGQYEVVRTLANAGYVVHVNDYRLGRRGGGRALALDWIQRYGLIILNGRYGGAADPPIPSAVIAALVGYVKEGGSLLVVADGGGIGEGKTSQYYNPLLRSFGLSFLEGVSLPYEAGTTANQLAATQVRYFTHVHGAPLQVSDGEVLGYVDNYPVIALARHGKGKVVAAGLGPILTGGNLRMEQDRRGSDNVQRNLQLLLVLTACLLSP